MNRPKKKTADNAVKKHSAAIQIEGNITLLQRKAWNILLWNAYDELLNKDRHSIRVSYLIQTLGFNSDNDEYLREALKALVHCSVEWNILDKDGHTEWGVAALLAEAKISNGLCTYAYGPTLREKLYSPSMYARLDLDMQKRFGSKHALALWELCTDYLGAKRDYGETPWIAVEDFRKLFGIAKNEYPAFWRIIQKVITPAKAEVNRVSDFNVTVEYQHQGRKTKALKFKMCRVDLLPEPAQTQGQIFPDRDDMPLVVKELRDAGLATQEALEIWQKGFVFVDAGVRPTATGEDTEAAFLRYVREKVHLLKRQQVAGKVENSTGFLREALRKNYANPEFTQEAHRQQAAEARQSAQQREVLRQHLTRQRDALRRTQEEAVGALLADLAETQPAVVEAAVTAAWRDNPFLRRLSDTGGAPLDQYRASLALRSVVNPTLAPHAAAAVAALEAQYAPQIEALDAQIAAL